MSHTRKFHTGIDIAGKIDTPIKAYDGGTVEFAGWKKNGYGNQVTILHSDGRRIFYGHMNSVGVHTGDTVTRQQTVGKMGSTGISTGPHLHFNVYGTDGKPVDPLKNRWTRK
ncbi:MAG: M23 family metallopeptidase [Armatimonadota bacterium]